MSRVNPVKSAFWSAIADAGFTKKADAWYRDCPETILVTDLQKSNFGQRYYVNLALWLKALGEASFPREPHCHIRLRASLLDPDWQQHWERAVFDLESDMREARRQELISYFVRGHCVPFLQACSSLEGVKRVYQQGGLKFAAITRAAAAILERQSQ